MKHYHGTPIGGKRHAADEFVDGRDVLIPWKRPEDLERACSLSRSFIVDNSAYTFWTTGEKPNWMDYVRWCRGFARNPRFEFALIPDVVDGTEADNNKLIQMWDKLANVPIRIKGCPVWHLHESLDRLWNLCDRWEYVAIGSSGEWPNPGQGGWWDRMDDAFDKIVDEHGFPKAKIHGLRMLREDIVSRYPFASCDSTNAAQNGTREARKNNVDASWGQQTLARRIEYSRSPSVWMRSEVQQTFELMG